MFCSVPLNTNIHTDIGILQNGISAEKFHFISVIIAHKNQTFKHELQISTQKKRSHEWTQFYIKTRNLKSKSGILFYNLLFFLAPYEWIQLCTKPGISLFNPLLYTVDFPLRYPTTGFVPFRKIPLAWFLIRVIILTMQVKMNAFWSLCNPVCKC